MAIQSLHQDVLELIFTDIGSKNPLDLVRLERVCKDFKFVCDKVWKRVAQLLNPVSIHTDRQLTVKGYKELAFNKVNNLIKYQIYLDNAINTKRQLQEIMDLISFKDGSGINITKQQIADIIDKINLLPEAWKLTISELIFNIAGIQIDNIDGMQQHFNSYLPSLVPIINGIIKSYSRFESQFQQAISDVSDNTTLVTKYGEATGFVIKEESEHKLTTGRFFQNFIARIFSKKLN